jgi:hypothetical protein
MDMMRPQAAARVTNAPEKVKLRLCMKSYVQFLIIQFLKLLFVLLLRQNKVSCHTRFNVHEDVISVPTNVHTSI